VVLTGDSRMSDSPFIDTIWRAQSEDAGSFISVATVNWEMVVSFDHHNGMTLTVRGPETCPTPASYAPGGEWFGISFKLGVLLPHLPVRNLVDRAVDLPNAGSRSFWLHGASWPFPDYDNADAFVDRLARDGLLAHDPLVEAASEGLPTGVSERSVQRRFVRATGLSQGTIRQISRARHAMALLERGTSILDTVHEAGYYDQPHLTRSLKRWLGQTPAQSIGIREPG